MNRRNSDLLSLAPFSCAAIALNIVLFLICAMRSQSLEIDYNVLLALGGSYRERMWEGEWQRIIVPNFLHANLMHILFNTMALLQLGPIAEIHFGSSNFGTIYLLSGVCGFCFSQLIGGTLSIGASCAIFGIMGAVLAVKIVAAPILRYAWRNSDVRKTAMWIAVYLGLGFIGMMRVDNWGHLGGLVGGLLFGFLFELWRKRQHLPVPMILAAVVIMAAIVCATRWTVFNPYYHVHQALLATKNGEAAKASDEYAQALDWGRKWKREPEIDWLITQAKEKKFNLEIARERGYNFVHQLFRYIQRNPQIPVFLSPDEPQ